MDRAEELFRRLALEGKTVIDELISERASEELFLEFKTSPDNGEGKKLAHADRAKLAKAISGFGNSEGGVIVWGVDCENLTDGGDVARAKRPIRKPQRFKSWLEASVSGCTLPPHPGVLHDVIQASPEDDEGFVLTLIPKSALSPHQCIVDPHKYRYFIRVGSNFDHVPHGVLAGMFGKHPQPYVFQMWKNYGGGMSGSNVGLVTAHPNPEHAPYCYLGFVLRNEGMAIARDLYVNLELGLPGPECASRVLPVGNTVSTQPWSYYSSFDHVHHVISDDGFKLAPGAMVEPVRIELFLKPPFDAQLFYRISFGCTGMPVSVISESIPKREVEQAYGAFVNSDRSKDAARQMANVVFRLDVQKIDELESADAEIF